MLVYFIFTYPAVRLFYFRLVTLPCSARLFYFHLPCYDIIFRLPCCAIIFRLPCYDDIFRVPAVSLSCFSLTLLWHYFSLTPAVPLFYFRLPCCTLIPLYDYHLPCCAPTLLQLARLFSSLCIALTARITLAHRLRRRGVELLRETLSWGAAPFFGFSGTPPRVSGGRGPHLALGRNAPKTPPSSRVCRLADSDAGRK